MPKITFIIPNILLLIGIFGCSLTNVETYGPIDVAVSDDYIYFSELGGRLRIFDIKNEKIAFVSKIKPRCSEDNQSFHLFKEDSKVYASITCWGKNDKTLIYELSENGTIELEKTIPGIYSGHDKNNIYFTKYISKKESSGYEPFRIEKKTKNVHPGHFHKDTSITILDQVTDISNYWYLCEDESKGAIYVVEKSKLSSEFKTYTLPNIKYVNISICSDSNSLWLLVYDHINSYRIIHFDKNLKKFTLTPFYGAESFIQNLDEEKKDNFIYFVHQSHQIFPMRSEYVLSANKIPASFLAIVTGHRLIPNPSGYWFPNDKATYNMSKSKKLTKRPNNIKRVIDSYSGIYYGVSFTYRDNLWLIGRKGSRSEDNGLYDIIKIPLQGDITNVYTVDPTAGETMNAVVKNSFRFAEFLGMVLVGGH